MRSHRWRRQVGLAASVVALAVVAQSKGAADNWINPAGGAFSTAANWSLGTAPGATTNIAFNLGTGVPYSVALPGPPLIANMLVENDSVTMNCAEDGSTDPNANTFLLDDLDVVAAAGQTTSLTLTADPGTWRVESTGQINVGGAGTTYLNASSVILYVSTPSPLGEQSFFNFGSGSTVVLGSIVGRTGAALYVGGNVSVASSNLIGGSVYIGGNGSNGATLTGTVGGMDASITVGQGGAGTFNGSLGDGETFTVGFNASGTANLQGASAEFTTNIGTFTGTGVLNVGAGASISAGFLTIGSKGSLNLGPGGLVSASNIAVSPGGTMNLAGGTLQLTNGTFNCSSVTVAPALTFIGVGEISGNVANSGTMEVGFLNQFSGALTIDGIFNQSSGGLLEILIDPERGASGVIANNELSLSASPFFAGTLDIAASSRVNFSAGEIFTVLSFPSESGTFSSVILPPLPVGLSWDTSQLYQTGAITVVPEPAKLAVMILAGVSMAARRHPRRLRF